MTEPREFVVRWEIPVLATTPQEAAELARAIMQDAYPTADYFEVFWGDPETSEMTEVYLDAEDPTHE